MGAGIIDTHIHVWHFDRARYSWLDNNQTILRKNYTIEEIEADRLASGITGGVLVQAAGNMEDTAWMLETAERTPWLSGVVGWLPLTDPAATGRLLENRNPLLKGVRHLIHDEADPRWLLQDTVIESLRLLEAAGLTYDIVGVLPTHIETALCVAERVPGLKMVFDHLNQPPIGAAFGEWGRLMKAASEHPAFYAKVSGLGTAAHLGNAWSAKDILPYVEFVLEHFGEDRCFCGGDWPVCLLAGPYIRTWQIYREVLTLVLGKEGQEKVLNDNARNFYQLICRS